MMDRWGPVSGISLIAILWFIFEIALIVAVIVGIIYLIKHLSGNEGRGTSGHDQAMEILRQRFARGEITEQEYEEMKEKLKR
ncbi:MAG: putative rane protein [Clostridiales bacterium]|nr:putative rane protein [Clostridiales bacterium]